MKQKRDVFDVKLDSEEQEISDAFDRGEFKSVDNLEEALAFAREAAPNFFCKNRHGSFFDDFG